MTKLHKWLNKGEAKLLGLKVRENAKNRKQNRYVVTPEQWEEIKSVSYF